MLCLRQPLLVLLTYWMSPIHLSVVIASSHPQKLSEFYAFATNGDLLPGISSDHYVISHPNGLSIQIYRPSKNRSWPDRGRSSALCLQETPSENPIFLISKWATSLISKGASIVEQPTLEVFGAESWLIDPEGNYFLIFVPKIKN